MNLKKWKLQPCKVGASCLDLQLVICKTVTRSSRLSSPSGLHRAWTSGIPGQKTQPRPGPKKPPSDLSDAKAFQQWLPWPSKVIWFPNRLPFCTCAQPSILSRHLHPLKILTLDATSPSPLTATICPGCQGQPWATAGSSQLGQGAGPPVPEPHLLGTTGQVSAFSRFHFVRKSYLHHL